MLRQTVLVRGIDLVTVAMAFGDLSRLIDLRNPRAALQHRRVRAQPHGAAHIAGQPALLQLISLHPFGHEADDRLRRSDKFRGVGGFNAAKIPRRLDHGHLHAEANSEIRHATLARELRGANLSLGAALTKSARHQNAVNMFKKRYRILVLEHLAFDPIKIDLDLVGYPAMRERLDQRLISILHS